MSVYKSEAGKETLRRRVGELIRELPFDGESRFLPTGGFGRTHCLTAGPEGAPALVLIHGSSSNAVSWAGYMNAWKDRFRMFALDMPGQPGLSGDTWPGLSRMGAWLETCLDALGLEKPSICAMSLGSWVAVDLALARPERVKKLCLITSSGFGPPRASFFLRILPLMFLGSWGTRRIGRIVEGPADTGREAREFGVLVSRHFKPMMEPIPLFEPERLAELTPPVLYFGGDRDALLDSEETGRVIRESVPEADVRILPGQGHVLLGLAGEIGEWMARGGL